MSKIRNTVLILMICLGLNAQTARELLTEANASLKALTSFDVEIRYEVYSHTSEQPIEKIDMHVIQKGTAYQYVEYDDFLMVSNPNNQISIDKTTGQMAITSTNASPLDLDDQFMKYINEDAELSVSKQGRNHLVRMNFAHRNDIKHIEVLIDSKTKLMVWVKMEFADSDTESGISEIDEKDISHMEISLNYKEINPSVDSSLFSNQTYFITDNSGKSKPTSAYNNYTITQY